MLDLLTYGFGVSLLGLITWASIVGHHKAHR